MARRKKDDKAKDKAASEQPVELALQPEQPPSVEPEHELPVDEPLTEPEQPADKPDEPPPVPSIEDIIRAGYSLEEAQEVIKDEIVKRDLALKAGRAHYKVSCASKRGYWKIGRHFTNEEVILFADEMTAEEIAEMDRAQAVHLTVVRVGFDED